MSICDPSGLRITMPALVPGIKILTDIVRVELIHSNKDTNSDGAEGPCGEGAEDGELALVHVIDQARVKLCRESESSPARVVGIGYCVESIQV